MIWPRFYDPNDSDWRDYEAPWTTPPPVPECPHRHRYRFAGRSGDLLLFLSDPCVDGIVHFRLIGTGRFWRRPR